MTSFPFPATPKMPAHTNSLILRTAQLDRSGGGGGGGGGTQQQQPKAKRRRQSAPATPSSTASSSTPAAAGAASRPAAAAATAAATATTTMQRVRHSTGTAGGDGAGSGSSPLSILHAAAATQERLDGRRKEIEAAVTGGGGAAAAAAAAAASATARVHPVVASAVAQLLRSLHADRETARVCMKGLLIGDVALNAKKLASAQASQGELLERCAHALGFNQLVGRIEQYLRDRNLPRGTSSYCLDQGAGSWARIRTAKIDLPIPPTTEGAAAAGGTGAAGMTMGGAFSACALEVTTQVPLASVGQDIRSLHRLFQPLTARILAAGPAPAGGGRGGGGREMQLVIEVATAAGASTGGGGTPFLVEAYGYRTAFGQAALDADDALLRTWAGSLPPPPRAPTAAANNVSSSSSSYRCPSTRHVLGLQITLPHPLLAPGFAKAPLTVLLSVR